MMPSYHSDELVELIKEAISACLPFPSSPSILSTGRQDLRCHHLAQAADECIPESVFFLTKPLGKTQVEHARLQQQNLAEARALAENPAVPTQKQALTKTNIEVQTSIADVEPTSAQIRLLNFADQAFDHGCRFFISDDSYVAGKLAETLGKSEVWIVYHPCIRICQNLIAQKFYAINDSEHGAGKPLNYQLIGITGTNGKTSCTHFCAQALALLGKQALVVGTLGAYLYTPSGDTGSKAKAGYLRQKVVLPNASLSGLTTPSGLQLLRLLYALNYSELVDTNVDTGAISGSGSGSGSVTCYVCIEVSSHGIDQGRLDNVKFAVKALTNITQDHLDYHNSFEQYASVKCDWILAGVGRRAVNASTLAHFTSESTRELLTNAVFDVESASAEAPTNTLDYRGRKVLCISRHSHKAAYAEKQLDIVAVGDKGEIQKAHFHTGLIGNFNVENLACVALIMVQLGETLPEVAQALKSVKPAPGRLEKVELVSHEHKPNDTENSSGNSAGNNAGIVPWVYVDYAHTPDALHRVLTTLSELKTKNSKLWTVFGCGGDRDRAKREKMGAIAQRLSQRVVVTNDNPRSEDPVAIALMIENGFHPSQPVSVKRILDRGKAIDSVIMEAANDDVILIAGKGHEDYQIIGEEKRHFSDIEVARKALERRVAGVRS